VKKTILLKWTILGMMIVLLASCGNSSNSNNQGNNENNSSDDISKEILTITAHDFNLTMDVNESVLSSNWKELSFATPSDKVIPCKIKTQGTYGTFALNGDTLIYIQNEEGNVSDQAVLTLGSGEKTTDITIQIKHLYWTEVAAGYYYTMAIKSDGTLWGWGYNNFGQLGDGTTIDRSRPTKIGVSKQWKHVYTKINHTMAIKKDGTLWGWGRNSYGQIGNGTKLDKRSPTQEPSKSKEWEKASTGAEFSVALKKDGTIWTTGRNLYGQLGNNTAVDSRVFQNITSTGTAWKDISAGYYHASAIKNDGTMWNWGRNNYGQVGDTTVANKKVPTQEALGDSNWAKTEAGYNYTLALKSDGTLWGWGYNGNGQIGDGTRTAKKVPVQEASMASDWVGISGGSSHSVGIKSDHTLWGWGTNNYGQIGDGINNLKDTPDSVNFEESWTQVSASQFHTVALTTQGTIKVLGATTGVKNYAKQWRP